jgi:hypothetical protein
MMTCLAHVPFLPSVLVLLLATTNAALAQPNADAGAPRVELELEGGVERVFISDEQSDDTRLVQLALRSVALADARIPLRHVRVPAPGDVLFVVVGDSSDTGRFPRAESGELPRAGDRIRAMVRDDGRGVWTAAGTNWFETVESPLRRPEREPTTDPRRETDSSPASRIARSLGISVETARAGLRGAVKVATVEPTRPGAAAGLEPGDVIVAVNRTRVANIDDFAQALPAQGGQVTLIVRDVRTGEEVPVEVRAAGARSMDNDRPQTPKTPAAEGVTTDRFGIAGELTFFNEEAAVKVVSVKPGSPASRAGIRAGWIILKANDEPVLHPDDLAKAEEAAGGRLTLRVVDPSTDRQHTIDIQR